MKLPVTGKIQQVSILAVLLIAAITPIYSLVSNDKGVEAVMAITSITPSTGPTAGGTTVTITGTGLVPPAPAAPTTMQQMSQAYCVNSMSVYPDTTNGPNTLTLTDTRNNQDYQVRKLADNNCWMIENMKLKGVTLTSADSNVTSSFVLPNTLITTDAERAANGRCDNGSATGTDGYLTCAGTYNGTYPANNFNFAAIVDPSGTTACSTNTNIYPAQFGDSHTYLPETSTAGCGYFYNWYTATAGQGTYDTPADDTNNTNAVAASICPASWRLPKAGDGTAGIWNEFSILSGAMAGDAGPNITNNATHRTRFWATGPFVGSYAGGWTNGPNYQGYLGYYWSSSAQSAFSAWDLYFTNSNIYPGNANGGKPNGNAVRCVLSASTTVAPVVTFDGIPATNVTVVNDTTITATAPAHTAGLVDVTVNNGVDSQALSNSYRYYAPMAVTDITPDTGPTAGGTGVTITGTNFQSQSMAIKQVTAGITHTCAIASDDNGYCWGNNKFNSQGGALGNNSITNSSVPVAVYKSGALSGKTIKQISASEYYTCAIASDNQTYCWGYNNYGQLGTSSVAIGSSSLVPIAVDTSGVLNGKTIKQITTGRYHACAIASDDQVYCWGNNSTGGQLGNNSTTNSSVPVAVNTAGVLSGKTIKQISAGAITTCAIASDNQAYCWGYGAAGALGNNSVSNSSVPVAVNTAGVLSGKTIKSVSVDNHGGSYATSVCVIASDNQAYCWGYGAAGALGNNSVSNSSVPVAVDTSGVLSGKTIVQISAGYGTCVIASDDQVYCWGDNGYGQLGNNSTTNSSVPVAVNTSGVLSGETILQVSTGGNNTCVIASDNQAYCWGYNYYGQLGNNSTTNSSVPVAVDNSIWRHPFTVTFDSSGTPANCTNVVVVNSTTITCTTSAHIDGHVKVTVNNGLDPAVTSASDLYYYHDPMTITSITPNYGLETGGTSVTITGTSFIPSAPTTPTTMQQMSQSYCQTMTVYDGTNPSAILTLPDTRNSQNYQIAKLADGNCWMLNNLKLGSTTGTMTLYGDDTNLGTGLHSTTATLPQVGTTTDTQYDQPRAYGPVPGQSDDITSSAFYGYLYNWCAATANDPATCVPQATMPTSATIDICPVNWRMPTGGPTGEFAILNGSMFNNTPSAADTSTNSAHGANFQFNGPFKGVLAGNRDGSSWSYRGLGGYVWSGWSNPFGLTSAYDLYFDSSYVVPGTSTARYVGFAVRCMTPGGTATPTITLDSSGTPVQATNVTVVNNTTITATVPAHTPGLVSVTVNNGMDSVTLPATYKDAGNNTQPCTGSPLPTRCNGQLDSGETRNQDRANIVSGFLYEELYIKLTSSGPAIFGATPTSTTAATTSGSQSLTTQTNNPTGYTLSLAMAPDGPDTGSGPTCTANKALTHTDTTNTIPASTNPWVTNGIPNTTLTTNTWGYSLTNPTTNNNYFMGIAPCSTPQTIKTTTTPNEAGDNTTVYYGAKIDISKKAGTYTGTVIYRAIVQP